MLSNVGIERLELRENARQIRVDILGINVAGQKNDVKRQCVGSWVNREVVKIAEGEVRIEG